MNILKKTGYAIEYIALIVIIILVWAVMGQTGQLNTVILPTPQAIVETFVKLISKGTLLQNLWISLIRTFKTP